MRTARRRRSGIAADGRRASKRLRTVNAGYGFPNRDDGTASPSDSRQLFNQSATSYSSHVIAPYPSPERLLDLTGLGVRAACEYSQPGRSRATETDCGAAEVYISVVVASPSSSNRNLQSSHILSRNFGSFVFLFLPQNITLHHGTLPPPPGRQRAQERLRQ